MAKKVAKVRDKPRETIARVMMVDHGKVVQLLKKFENSLEGEDIKTIIDSYDALHKKLDNHFEMEEHVIFDHLTDPSQGVKEDLALIMKEHITIMDYLKHFWGMLQNGPEIPGKDDFELFLNMLKNHARFEDEIFYPRLDEQLEVTEKAEIVSGIIDSTGYIVAHGEDDGGSL